MDPAEKGAKHELSVEQDGVSLPSQDPRDEGNVPEPTASEVPALDSDVSVR